MKILIGAAVLVFSIGASPVTATNGELVLFKETIIDEWSRSPFGGECAGLFPVNPGENIPDMRGFQYYFCEGIYSLTLEGPPQSTVTLFGSFFHKTEQGYLILRKTDNRKVWVIHLDWFEPGKWIHVASEDERYGSYDVYYREAPSFERNVSSVKWGQWWTGEPPPLSNN